MDVPGAGRSGDDQQDLFDDLYFSGDRRTCTLIATPINSSNRIGPLVGVIFMLLLPEALRFVGLPDAIAHNIREIIYGLLLAALMYLRPRGLAGEFKMA